jgi:hypothetical protein
VASVVAGVEQRDPDLRLWRAVLDGVAATAWHDVLSTVAKRRGWLQKKRRPEEVVRDQVQRLAMPRLRALLAEIVLTRDALRPCGSPSYSKPLTLACQAVGIDLPKVEHQVDNRSARTEGRREPTCRSSQTSAGGRNTSPYLPRRPSATSTGRAGRGGGGRSQV